MKAYAILINPSHFLPKMNASDLYLPKVILGSDFFREIHQKMEFLPYPF